METIKNECKFSGIGGLDLIMENISVINKLLAWRFQYYGIYKDFNTKERFVKYFTNEEEIMKLSWEIGENTCTRWEFEFLQKDEEKRQELKRDIQDKVKDFTYEWQTTPQNCFLIAKKSCYFTGGLELIVNNLNKIDEFLEKIYLVDKPLIKAELDNEDRGHDFSIKLPPPFRKWQNEDYKVLLRGGGEYNIEKFNTKWYFTIHGLNRPFVVNEEEAKEHWDRVRKFINKLLKQIVWLRYDWQE